jgi:HlyD family secretion protein
MTTNNGAGLNHSLSVTPAQDKRPAYPQTNPEVGTIAARTSRFDQPVLLQQSPIWSRAILWVLMGVTTTVIVWASVAKIEEAIPAQGKLEPLGAVKDVQAPVGGVVKAIYVDDGQRVEQGERLISLEPVADQAQLASLKKIRAALIQENQFYQAQMSGMPSKAAVEQATAQLKLPPELVSLTKSRAALAAENQLYRAQFGGSAPGSRLSSEQQERLQSNQAELNSRVTGARLEVEQLTKQLNQNQIQLASAKDTLAMNQQILNDIQPLAKIGAFSRIQFLKQQQEVRTAQSELDQLTQEQLRLQLEISAGKSKLSNTLALDRKDLLTQMADNDKRIAEIDSQLSKAMVENNKRIAEIDSQLSQTQLNLKYQVLRAPVSGTVFDLQAHAPGFVTNSTTPVLKVVPDDALTAKVFISNQDIGFVKEGMNVDVRIDSFPFSEFGDIKGQLVWIGSDALPPDQIRPFYSFPAKVQIEQQSLLVNDRQVPLQSGMSVSANIKLRQRTVMSIFTDLFSKKIESLKFVR